ncbi:hypothetical protein QL093DRAFT_2364429, partial [Fusarium oxysporum]
MTGPKRAINVFIHFVTQAGFGWATSLGLVAATVALLVSDKRTGGRPTSFSCNLPVRHCSVSPAHQPHKPKPKPKMVSPNCPGHPFLDGVNKRLWLVAPPIILISDAGHYYGYS